MAEKHVDRGDRLRQNPPKVGERRLDCSCELQSVGVGLLLDREDHRGLAHVACVPALDAGRVIDGGDLAEAYGNAPPVGDSETLKVLQASGAPDVADEVFARMLINETAGGIRSELSEYILDFVAADVEARHLRHVQRDPVLPHFAADRDDLSDSWYTEQARAYHPVN